MPVTTAAKMGPMVRSETTIIAMASAKNSNPKAAVTSRWLLGLPVLFVMGPNARIKPTRRGPVKGQGCHSSETFERSVWAGSA